ncbi:type II toxin-antitoxin system HicA family toxin [Candidatus Peregrinibacteria bacterium]|nr:type II toxin-antitoxin system HicA family toxin [Candidatus Peregrinibacteria bacterium]
MSKYNYTPKKLIRLLSENGFLFVRQNGSHAIFKNFQTNRKVIVPIHSSDIPKGTAGAILKDAGIDLIDTKV